MNNIGSIITMFLVIVPFLALSQEVTSEYPECVTIDSFRLKCEKGLSDMEKYLNDSTLIDSDHQNIMYCYNQLHWDVIGEPIDRLKYRDTLNLRSNKDHADKRFTADQNDLFSALFEKYKKSYSAYIDLLILEFESSYGLGGALYIDNLKTYPSTANGRTYFVLCE